LQVSYFQQIFVRNVTFKYSEVQPSRSISLMSKSGIN